MLKTVYIFDTVYGEYLYPYDAQENPDVPGEFIMPVMSTDTPPPNAGAHQKACFINGAWEIKPDYRGEVWYDASSREPVTIDFIGPLPSNLISGLPPLPITVVTPLQARRALISAGLFQAVTSVIESSSLEVQQSWEHASSFDRDNQILLQLAVQMGLTAEQVDQLFLSAASFT